MNPLFVTAALATLIVFSTIAGVLWQANQGRVRSTERGPVFRASDIPGTRRFAPGATLLQFSTEVCAPCRATRTILQAIASERFGVAHIDLDLTHRPDLAVRFGITQTPTTLILDGGGVVRARIGGAPRRDALAAELDRILVAV